MTRPFKIGQTLVLRTSGDFINMVFIVVLQVFGLFCFVFFFLSLTISGLFGIMVVDFFQAFFQQILETGLWCGRSCWFLPVLLEAMGVKRLVDVIDLFVAVFCLEFDVEPG